MTIDHIGLPFVLPYSHIRGQAIVTKTLYLCKSSFGLLKRSGMSREFLERLEVFHLQRIILILLPLIGNLLDVPTKREWETITQWGKQYGTLNILRL